MKKCLFFFLGFATSFFSILILKEIEPPPSAFPILKRKGYKVAYDTRFKIPFWTYEHLEKAMLQKNFDRSTLTFKKDPSIYKAHQSTLSDYRKSSFDRGHSVPTNDLSFSKQALEDSFLLSNIYPQHPKLNRGLWAKLEKNIRSLLQIFEWVNVTTGPLFLPQKKSDGKNYITFQVIGKNQVAVPTHFFKVIETPKNKWAYVIPNHKEISEPLEKYLFSIKELEKLSGICFTTPDCNLFFPLARHQ